MIETQADLTRDARQRGYKPGALCVMVDGATVLVTSWPWMDGKGDEQCAKIMARAEPDDPMTNREVRYFALMRKVGEQDL